MDIAPDTLAILAAITNAIADIDIDCRNINDFDPWARRYAIASNVTNQVERVPSLVFSQIRRRLVGLGSHLKSIFKTTSAQHTNRENHRK